MSFTSEGFFLFLALFFALYYLTPRSYRPLTTLCGSFAFAYFGGYLPYLAFTALFAYISARVMSVTQTSRARKIVFACGLLPLLSALAAFKAGNAAFGILLPLGISFYTFQCAGYLIDVYREKVEAERSVLRFALFASFFPQIMQGPISRFADLAPTLFDPPRFSSADFCAGLRRILWGFFKKLVVADRLWTAVRVMSDNASAYRGLYVALNVLLYAVTLYADFTGGIDITIGIAKTMGVTVAENFDRPFYAKNVAEYWRRWHITMGSWFRDYLFYPLSVCKPSRRLTTKLRAKLGSGIGRRIPVYIATMITWLATGAWHGFQPHYIAWGIANGIVIAASQELTPLYARFRKRFAFTEGRAYAAFAVARTFVLMSFIRSFDIYRSVKVTLVSAASVFTLDASGDFGALGLTVADCAVAVVAIAIMILAGRKQVRALYERCPVAVRYALCLLLLCGTLVFGAYGRGYDAGGFIYTRF